MRWELGRGRSYSTVMCIEGFQHIRCEHWWHACYLNVICALYLHEYVTSIIIITIRPAISRLLFFYATPFFLSLMKIVAFVFRLLLYLFFRLFTFYFSVLISFFFVWRVVIFKPNCMQIQCYYVWAAAESLCAHTGVHAAKADRKYKT